MQLIHLDPLPGTGVRMTGFLHDPPDQFIPEGERPCVVVFPGGGYHIHASHEAEPVAMQFYTAGCQVFILYYTVQKGGEGPLGLTPLCDASTALITIRENAAAWRVDPERIAVCGFSAGGHLAGSLGTLWDSGELRARMDTQNGRNRPNAMILCYPVLTAGDRTHEGSMRALVGKGQDRQFFSLEKQVNAGTPPAFLWHTMDDDAVPVENSLLFLSALRAAGVDCEGHLFPHGPHGLGLAEGLAESDPAAGCAAWMSLCLRWLGEVFRKQ